MVEAAWAREGECKFRVARCPVDRFVVAAVFVAVKRVQQDVKLRLVSVHAVVVAVKLT